MLEFNKKKFYFKYNKMNNIIFKKEKRIQNKKNNLVFVKFNNKMIKIKKILFQMLIKYRIQMINK